MACTGIKDYDTSLPRSFEKDKYERMIDLALELINEVSVKRFGSKEINDFITLKIGIHGGKVIYDIIGFHKVQFKNWKSFKKIK